MICSCRICKIWPSEGPASHEDGGGQGGGGDPREVRERRIHLPFLLRPTQGSVAELEAVHPGHIGFRRDGGPDLGIRHKQEVGEGCAEEGAVYAVMVLALGVVDILAQGAVQLQGRRTLF